MSSVTRKSLVWQLALSSALAIAAASSHGNAQAPRPSTANAPATVARIPATAGAPVQDSAPARARGKSSIHGRVWDAAGQPARAVVVALTPSDSATPGDVRMVGVDSAGRFAIDSIAGGGYTLDVLRNGRQVSAAPVRLDGTAALEHDLQIPKVVAVEHPGWEILITFLFLLAYVLALLGARWHHVAKASREMAAQQLATLRTRLDTEAEDDGSGRLTKLRKSLDDLVTDWKEWSKARLSFFEVFFWSRGRENAAWVDIHEIERQLAAFLSPPAQVDAYLRSVHAELRQINKPVAIVMADAVRDALQVPRPATMPERLQQGVERKALLGRALAIVYRERDENFSTAMEWQNKAGWLTLAAILLILTLTISAGHAILFLAGAAGGYLSRLERALKSPDIPLDYGASWTTLYLSPVLGALAGWFGVALITLAATPELNLLGAAFSLVSWDNPGSSATLAIAFVLGFSERLFDSIVGAVDDQSQTRQAGALAASGSGGAGGPPPPDALPRAALLTAQGRNGDGKAPALTATRARDANGSALPELVLTGDALDATSIVKVNGTKRTTTPDPPRRLRLPLDDADQNRLRAAGDFRIVVTAVDRSELGHVDYVDSP